MLKLLRLRRFTLVLMFFSGVLSVLLGTSLLLLWFSTDVEKLVKHYPVYNAKTEQYEFNIQRPSSWVKIDQISKYAKQAIIVSEDWAFYQHPGIDMNQLRIVIGESIKQAKLVRGASTITQQVIKNTILTSEKSLWRKFREMILAFKLEMYLSKDKILEIYLNIVELGKDIYGIGPAAQYYFNKKPALLTAREGAFLAMLLPSPVKYMTSFKRKELTPFAREVVDSILVKLRQADVYDEETRLIEAKKLFYWEQKYAPVDSNVDNNEFLDYQIYE